MIPMSRALQITLVVGNIVGIFLMISAAVFLWKNRPWESIGRQSAMAS